MRIRATATMATVLLCAANWAPADVPPPGLIKSYGPGTRSCGEWLANRDQTTALQILQHAGQMSWMLGWLTAAGYYDVRAPLRHTDSDAISAWVDKYCRENPLNKIEDAAVGLVIELSKPE